MRPGTKMPKPKCMIRKDAKVARTDCEYVRWF